MEGDESRRPPILLPNLTYLYSQMCCCPHARKTVVSLLTLCRCADERLLSRGRAKKSNGAEDGSNNSFMSEQLSCIGKPPLGSNKILQRIDFILNRMYIS
ncbi:Ribulose bisphosphate carboxylase small subunit, chloroplastic [Dirofilaria immitis]